MKQLAAARAVITIWTSNSIKSDWVRAEAGRAKAEAKLIPVKTPDVAYAEIPLPFGEMHTENIASTDLIRAAIVTQLAKPAVTPSTFWRITGLFRYNVLTWVGIVGSTITLFANLNGVLNLADWARELVTHWLPMGYLLYTSKNRLWVFTASLLVSAMGQTLLLLPYAQAVNLGIDVLGIDVTGWTRPRAATVLVSSYMLFPIYYMGVVLFSPIRQLTRRLGFVVMGVITLVGLSEISKLNLHQYLQPPRVSDNSGR